MEKLEENIRELKREIAEIIRLKTELQETVKKTDALLKKAKARCGNNP
jgi:F0F1-type ATP synthase membrane subunit b/b'